MSQSFSSRQFLTALFLGLALQIPAAFAADITASPPSGGGFAVTNSAGTLDRFRVEEASGTVSIPGLPAAAIAETPACFDNPGGRLGPCAWVGTLDFANFYALMPPDNAATIAPGTDVSFPQDGPNSGGGITRATASSFTLSNIGTYQVMFQVSVAEAGQFILTLNGAGLAYTVVGRATGTSQITGMALVQTSVIDSILTVRNPAASAAALTISPLAGGAEPVSAHLVITQLQ